MKYNKEDLQNDIDYLVGYGLKEYEAEYFIKYLINKEPIKSLKLKEELEE